MMSLGCVCVYGLYSLLSYNFKPNFSQMGQEVNKIQAGKIHKYVAG